MATQVQQHASLATAVRRRPVAVPAAVTVGLGALVVLYYATLLSPRHAWESWIIKEDRVVEMPGSLALGVASVVFFLAFRHLRRTTAPRLLVWACLALAAVFFFGFGEELSWGQRLLGFGKNVGTGDLNSQNEINIHNLKFFSGWFSVDRMFQVFWFSFGVVIPLAARYSRRADAWLRRLVPILPVAIAWLLLANQLAADLWRMVMDSRYASIYPLHYGVYEIKESVISILLAAGAYFWYRSIRSGAADSDAAL